MIWLCDGPGQSHATAAAPPTATTMTATAAEMTCVRLRRVGMIGILTPKPGRAPAAVSSRRHCVFGPCCPRSSDDRLSRLPDMPVWSFHGKLGTVVTNELCLETCQTPWAPLRAQAQQVLRKSRVCPVTPGLMRKPTLSKARWLRAICL